MGGRPKDRVFLWSLRVSSFVTASILVLIVGFLLVESLPGLIRVSPFRFLTDPDWQPGAGRFDLVAMGVATLATTVGAAFIAAPVGVLTAIFCVFYAPDALNRPLRAAVELMAGIPSVVYGFWGLVTLVPLVRELAPPGPSLLAGILVLAMMIVPTITLLAHAALVRVPKTQLAGAAALGLSRWSTVRGVVLPSAASGLGIAVVLGIMRAVGETMAVLMVCGNVTRIPNSLFDPVRTLTANIALELGYATAEHRSILFVSGLVLMFLVVGLVALGERIARSVAHA